MKTAIQNRLQAIYDGAGYVLNVDNRSYFTKSLNKALQNDGFVIEICKKGFVWTAKSGFKYNVKIRFNGVGKLFKVVNPTPQTLCVAAARVLELHKEKNVPNVAASRCSKCNGVGKIPAFYHIADGVCFDCLGVGYKF